MTDERTITFRCKLDEAEKLFDLLYRIAEATWSAYEREFSEQASWGCLDEYEAHLERLGDDHHSEYCDDEIPF